jgi:hypothetical protein
MAVKVYKGGKFRPMSGTKMYNNKSWVLLKNEDKLKVNDNWCYLGEVEWGEISYLSECSNSSVYVISNGLYRVDDERKTLLDGRSGWTIAKAPQGYNSIKYSNTAYAINNGKLYFVDGFSITQVGTSNAWKCVSVFSSNDYLIGVGICGDKLYKLNGKNVEIIKNQPSSQEKWRDAVVLNSNYDFFAITNNMVYLFTNNKWESLVLTNISQLSCSLAASGACYAYVIYNEGFLVGLNRDMGKTTFKNKYKYVNGYYTNSSSHAYAITNDGLYYIKDSKLVEMDSSEGWTCVQGYYYNNRSYGYAIKSGKLYYIDDKLISLIDDSGNWSDVKIYDYNCGYGIKDDQLYHIKNNETIVLVGNE